MLIVVLAIWFHLRNKLITTFKIQQNICYEDNVFQKYIWLFKILIEIKMVMEVQECILRDQKVLLNNEIKCGKALNINNINFVILLKMLLNCITESPYQSRSCYLCTEWKRGKCISSFPLVNTCPVDSLKPEVIYCRCKKFDFLFPLWTPAWS